MRGALDNCDDRRHGALRWQWSWSIMMTRAMEHCDDTAMEHCDDKNSGAL